MNCPVCKCPNPAGATHCNMCYEVFNRSAAQAYLQSIRRERRIKEGDIEDPEVKIISQRQIDKKPSWFSRVDWHAAGQAALLPIRKNLKWILFGLGIIGVWLVIQFLFSVSLWYDLFGKKLTYAFPEKGQLQYLVGMKQNVKIWSERQGRLDTPMERRMIDEMGNIVLQKTPGKGNTLVKVEPREWIQILNEEQGSVSRTIPLKHPTLSPGKLVFGKEGNLLERRFASSPRLGKSVPFLAIRFPTKRLQEGETWKENVEWIDDYHDWKVRWKGTLMWTIGELTLCGEGMCAQLRSTTELKPQLIDTPTWAKGSVQGISGKATAEGWAQFDVTHERLLSHEFSYEGLLRMPINTLERIPIELRVGRRVKGPGDIAIFLENKIDIRKN